MAHQLRLELGVPGRQGAPVLVGGCWAGWWPHAGGSNPQQDRLKARSGRGVAVYTAQHGRRLGMQPLCSCLTPSACAPWFMQLLVKKPADRLPLEQVLQHPWIQANADPAVLARAT